MVGLPPISATIPEPTAWQFPDLDTDEDRLTDAGSDLIAIGADLEPGTLLAAYATGFFPMPINRRQIGWFSPDPRGVIMPTNLKVSRSLRRSTRRFHITVNQAFDQVLAGCADPSRPQGWIDNRIAKAYRRLHLMGWVHSIEVWDDEGLAGGLYGVGIGGLFAGESMFHRRTDASKVALVHLVELVGDAPTSLIDVQWATDHLVSLGAAEWSRTHYRSRLGDIVSADGPFPSPG